MGIGYPMKESPVFMPIEQNPSRCTGEVHGIGDGTTPTTNKLIALILAIVVLVLLGSTCLKVCRKRRAKKRSKRECEDVEKL